MLNNVVHINKAADFLIVYSKVSEGTSAVYDNAQKWMCFSLRKIPLVYVTSTLLVDLPRHTSKWMLAKKADVTGWVPGNDMKCYPEKPGL